MTCQMINEVPLYIALHNQTNVIILNSFFFKGHIYAIFLFLTRTPIHLHVQVVFFSAQIVTDRLIQSISCFII